MGASETRLLWTCNRLEEVGLTFLSVGNGGNAALA